MSAPEIMWDESLVVGAEVEIVEAPSVDGNSNTMDESTAAEPCMPVDENADQEVTDSTGRKSYTIQHKLKSLNVLKQNNNNFAKTAREMGISRVNIQRWSKQKELLKALKEKRGFNIRTSRRKNKVGLNSGKYKVLESNLLEWVRDQRVAAKPVNGKNLRNKALLLRGDENEEFRASVGWSHRFLRRHGLVRRAVTSVGQQIPANAQYVATHFLSDVVKNMEENNFAQTDIANMDEVPVYFDMPRNHTIDYKGLHTIKINTTGNEHLRFTVVLTMLGNGHKLKPMIIFKGLKNVPNQAFPAGKGYRSMRKSFNDSK